MPVQPAVLVVVLICAGLFLRTYSNARAVMAVLVGASGTLILVQVQGLHLFTFAAIGFAFVSNRRASFSGQHLILIFASALLGSTVLLGELVTSAGLGIQIVALALSAVLISAHSDSRDVGQMRSGFVFMSSLGAAAAIGQAVGALPDQLFQLQGAEMHRPAGIYPEPDWLGLYSAVGLVFVLGLGLARRYQFALILLHFAAILLASARAAIVALIVAAILATVLALRSRNGWVAFAARSRLPVLLLAVLTSAALAAMIFPTETALLLRRIGQALNPGGDSLTAGRLGQTRALQQLFETAPWYGHGLSASGRVTGFGGILYGEGVTNSTGSNWFYSLLAEGKVLAVPFISFIIYWAILGGRQVGGIALALVLTNSLFSNAVFFPVTWLALAIAMGPRPNREQGDGKLPRRGALKPPQVGVRPT